MQNKNARIRRIHGKIIERFGDRIPLGRRTADVSAHPHFGKRKRVLRRRHFAGATALLVLLCVCSLAVPCVAGVVSHLAPLPFPSAPSPRVAQHAPFSYWEFGATEIDAKREILQPKPVEPIHYLQDKELPGKAQGQYARLLPDTTRAAVEKTWWENGGLATCQFLLLEKDGGPKFVAVTIEWRPAAMPERIFADRKLRLRWIRRHAPMAAPDDVAMRISRPYLAGYAID